MPAITSPKQTQSPAKPASFDRVAPLSPDKPGSALDGKLAYYIAFIATLSEPSQETKKTLLHHIR